MRKKAVERVKERRPKRVGESALTRPCGLDSSPVVASVVAKGQRTRPKDPCHSVFHPPRLTLNAAMLCSASPRVNTVTGTVLCPKLNSNVRKEQVSTFIMDAYW